MNLFAAYLYGIIASTLFRWALWKTPEKRWLKYWKEEPGPTIASAFFALVCFGLWEKGYLLQWVAKVYNGASLVVEWQTTVPAAAILDFFAVEIVEWAREKFVKKKDV